MNQFGQNSNKRDFDMAMGYDSSQPMGSAPFRQAAGMNPLGMQNHGMPAQPGYFFPQQMGMSYAPPPMNMPSMQIPPFDPQQMQFMNPPRFYAAPPSAPVQAEAAKDPAAKTNADWALEKRRARNRITAAESRRKCKEEIQNLRDELMRLKEEKQEKEELIEYYRNRYERYEGSAESSEANVSRAVPSDTAHSEALPDVPSPVPAAPSDTRSVGDECDSADDSEGTKSDDSEDEQA